MRRKTKTDTMKKRLFVLTMPCVLALCLHAAGVPVLRFVPVAGTESDVPMSSLQKVVFTQDGQLFIRHGNQVYNIYGHNMSGW